MIDIEKLQDEVNYWISLENEGINIQENTSFISWINKNERNKRAFNEEKFFINEINTLPNNLLYKLKQDVKDERKRINKRKRLVVSFGYFASAACILSVFYFSFFIDKSTFSKDYIASTKVREKIFLPDRSIISLDVKTAMEIKYYDDKREVYLSTGKAFFDVSSNKTKPFFVKTKNITIKVLGTKFEVVNTKNFELNVKEGKVAIWNKNGKLIALVTKNQSLSLNEYLKIDSLKEQDSSSMALWSEGKFNFQQESLKNVIAQFSKYENINVQIQNKYLENLPITGNFTSKEFDKIINVLPLIHPVKIVKNEDKIIIKEKI